jgi:hypothetical protein
MMRSNGLQNPLNNPLTLGSSEEGETFDRYADSDSIYEALARVTGEGLVAMMKKLAAHHDIHSPPEVLLLLARFLQAFPQLCGSLRTCLSLKRESDKSSVAYSFSRLESEFASSSCRMLNLWTDRLLAEMDRQLTAGSQQDLLAFFPAWDKISVQVR